MAVVHCKACGRSYRYESEGCCPSCGAYNRPPKRERVNADGTVQHMTDAAYEKSRTAHDKVCFEEKVCYEDQAIGGNKTANRVFTTTRSVGKGKAKPGRALVSLLAVIMAIIGIATNVHDRLGNSTDVPEKPDEPIYTTPVEEDEYDPADDYYYDAVMGDELITEDGSRFTVLSWQRDDQAKEITVHLQAALAEDSDHTFYPTLSCTDEDNGEVILETFTVTQTGDDEMELCFDAPKYDVLEPFALVMEEWEAGEDGELIDTWRFSLR